MSSAAQVSASTRIDSILDDNSFVEIGGYVTARSTDFNLNLKETRSDGVITGYGLIDSNLVYIYSQDITVMNGTMGEMHSKKISSLYRLAMKMGAPVIGLIDCAGLRLEEATDALNAFGELYMNQTLASGVIPQITAIFGVCGGGMALVPALTDFTFMEEKSAKLFVNAPNTIDGNNTSKCDSQGAKFQSEQAGLVDMIGDEESIISSIRELVGILPANKDDDMSYSECTDDLNRVCDGLGNAYEDASLVLRTISDDNFFFETKRDYAKEMVTGFIRLNGVTVGTVANRSEIFDENGKSASSLDAVLTKEGCEKASEFIDFCDAFQIPVASFVNVKGFKASLDQEKGMAKAAAKLTYSFANATIPKVSLIIGQAFGSAYITMNSKSIGADIVYAWPQASIGMMDSVSAARIMYADEIKASSDAQAMISQKAEEYQKLQSDVISAARRGYVDDIIEPQDTRKYLIGAFEMLFTKKEERPAKKHGCV